MDNNQTIELYKIIVGEKGYLHPQQHVLAMTEYYNAMGWPRGTKEDVMRFWMSGVNTKNHHEPELTDHERAYMVKFMSVIDRRLIKRFFDILIDFRLEGDVSIFYFLEEHKQNVANWMIATGLVDKMTDFAHEIKLRPAESYLALNTT